MSNYKAKILPEVIARIRRNKYLKKDIENLLDVSSSTLQRYLDTNNPILTRIDCIVLICNHLGLEMSDVTNMPEYQEAT